MHSESSELRVPQLLADRVERERAAVGRYLDQLETGTPPRGDLEAEFMQHVVRFSVRESISIDAWREYGVPDAILERIQLGH